MDSRNLQVVKEAFRRLEEEGLDASMETLFEHAHENTEFRPYSADGRVLRGPDEARAFFREQQASGTAMALRPASFEERGDEVVVTGSLRMTRPTGGFAESQMRWTYRFSDGRLDEAHWSPRDGD